MEVLVAVIDDLYRFAVDAILALMGGRKGVPHTPTLFSATSEIQSLNATLRSVSETGAHGAAVPGTPVQVADEVTFRTAREILTRAPERSTKAAALPIAHTVMYVSERDVPMYKAPTRELDTEIKRLPYGEMVMVIEEKGRFAHITTDGDEGWLVRETLADRAAAVYPEFVIGEHNDVDSSNTVRVRAIIQDMFGGGEIEYPLQAGEYVAYKLKRKGIRIVWPAVRPRVPGYWHTILRGVSGVHVGVSPKTGSVMEYMLSEDMGHLAYVEAVFPDETITLSEANFPDSGIYNERVLTREEWLELRPVFIQIS